jgi:hypothetical protein
LTQVRTIILPHISAVTPPQTYAIFDASGNCSAGIPIDIQTAGASEFIGPNGTTQVQLQTAFAGLIFRTDTSKTRWLIPK